MSKVTVVGAGNVGSTCGQRACAQRHRERNRPS